MDKRPDALKRASNIAGGAPALAIIARRTPAAIYHLLRQDRPCPPELVLPIEAGTGVSRHDLRPDIYPVERQASE